MDSTILLLVVQLPVIVLLAVAGYLLRSIHRERNSLAATLDSFESRFTELSVPKPTMEIDELERGLEELRGQLHLAMRSLEDSQSEIDRTREYMSNQKTALKEFGRVLSKTSEQTYSEMLAMEDRLKTIQQTLGQHGIAVDIASDAA